LHKRLRVSLLRAQTSRNGWKKDRKIGIRIHVEEKSKDIVSSVTSVLLDRISPGLHETCNFITWTFFPSFVIATANLIWKKVEILEIGALVSLLNFILDFTSKKKKKKILRSSYGKQLLLTQRRYCHYNCDYKCNDSCNRINRMEISHAIFTSGKKRNIYSFMVVHYEIFINNINFRHNKLLNQ